MSPVLDELVLQCLDRLEETAGDLESAVAPLLASHPELADDLRERLRALERVGLLESRGAGQEEQPSRIGEFDLERKIGSGGMGVVYLATQRGLQRKVALKLLRPGHFLEPGTRARFRREAEAAARLSHPNIVPVYIFGEENGVPCLAMEYVNGSSLDRILQVLRSRDGHSLRGLDFLDALRACRDPRDPDPPEPDPDFFAGTACDVVLRIAACVARALAHAHERGVLQRDVKPSNVMLCADGRVLLLDFGLSSLVGAERVTRSGSLIGSLPYMAPEQLRGEVVDARTDVYGLGVTLYELLTRRSPFMDPESAERTRAAILEGRPPLPRRVDSSIPKDVQSVCQVAMDADPACRYESAQALANDLANALARRPILARPGGPWRQLERWARRRPGTASAVVLAALLVFGAPTLLWWQASKARTRLLQEVDRADANHKETLAALALADRNYLEARASLARADQNFQRSLDAIDLVTRVAMDELADVPMAEQGRRDVLQGVAGFFEELAAEPGSGPELQLQRAAALTRLARTQEGLGELDAATASLMEALALFESHGVSADSPRARDRAYAHWYLAKIAERRGRARDALEQFDAALALLPEGALDEVPAAMDHVRIRSEKVHVWRSAGEVQRARDELLALIEELEQYSYEDHPDIADLAGWCYAETTEIEKSLGRTTELRASLERALELHEALSLRDPDARVPRQKWMIALSNLGAYSMNQGELSEAIEQLGQAEELAGELVEDFPGLAVYRYNLAGVLINLGGTYLKLDEHEESGENTRLASEALSRATGIMERLVAENPSEIDYISHFIGAATNLAAVQLAVEDFALALETLDRLAPVLEEFERLRPSDPLAMNAPPVCEMNRLRAHLSLGQVERACESARSLMDVPDLRFPIDAAGFLSMVLRTEGAPEEDRSLAREAILEVLESAVDAGFPVATLQADERFDPLRDDPLMQALLTR